MLGLLFTMGIDFLPPIYSVSQVCLGFPFCRHSTKRPSFLCPFDMIGACPSNWHPLKIEFFFFALFDTAIHPRIPHVKAMFILVFFPFSAVHLVLSLAFLSTALIFERWILCCWDFSSATTPCNFFTCPMSLPTPVRHVSLHPSLPPSTVDQAEYAEASFLFTFFPSSTLKTPFNFFLNSLP